MKHDMMFKQIIAIIEHDYVGFQECEKFNDARQNTKQYLAAMAKAWTRHELTDSCFFGYVEQYFATLQDRNLKFFAASDMLAQTTPGFRTRRFEDVLYVTEAAQEKALQPGDAFLTLNKSAPQAHLEYTIGNIVNGDEPERQLWDILVRKTTHGLLRRTDGTQGDFPINTYPCLSPARVNTFELLEGKVAYLTCRHFLDDSVTRLVALHDSALRTADKIIIDMRDCTGGDETNFHPLLSYLFAEDTSFGELVGPQEIYTNYSERNCALRVAQLELFSVSHGMENDPWIKKALSEYREKSGIGMLLEAVSVEDDFDIPKCNASQPVVLITDTQCEGAAEKLVRYAATSPKVTILGRPTMGTIDYGNPLTMALDGTFSLSYPMSKTKELVCGQGVLGKGIAPDEYVAWTPDECQEDLLLKRALAE